MSSSALPDGAPADHRPARRATHAGAFEHQHLTAPPSPRNTPGAPNPGATDAPIAGGPPAVSVENLGKCYHIYNKPEDRLKQALLRWRGTRFYEDFWALKDVSFDVAPGEAMGIVGRNGSGKSTLMQIIAGTLAPTTGSVTIRGRVAALLELGSGFNPDFTGRENVFLYGTILGLARRQVEQRFDEIAAFADIGRFLDQPVKTYSSGMKVRLAFAVQVQVRPEVLIIDEALTVGDNLFQKRCHERLRVLREAGTTLLFVSHQQEIIRTLTSRCLLLHKGRMRAIGAPGEVLLEYRRVLHEEEKRWTTQRLAAAATVVDATPPLPAPGLPATDRPGGPPVADVATASRPPEPAGTPSSATPGRPGAIPTDGPLDHAEPSVVEVERPEHARSFGDGDARITRVEILGSDAEGCSLFYPGDRVLIRVAVRFERALSNVNVALRIRDKQGVKIHSWGTLNQDIAARSGLRPYDDPTGAGGEHEGDSGGAAIFWDRAFHAGQTATVEFEWVCTLGAGFFEVQACVTHEPTPDYRNQRMLHWLDEAAFFEVKIARSEYFFGGITDLRMRANVMD